MKKWTCILLVIAMLMPLNACSNQDEEVFEISKSAYESINEAYDITSDMGDDIYVAWRLAIVDKDELSVSFLADELYLSEDELYLSEDELTEGIMEIWRNKFLDSMSSEDEDTLLSGIDYLFMIVEDKGIQQYAYCTLAVVNAYKINDKAEEAQAALDNAKEQIKLLSSEYSDYEHYPTLKEYYTTVSAYFSFCLEPEGSFEQLTTTKNDYTNTVRNCVSGLDYIFED